MNTRAVCFDLDGTLLDTIEDLIDSMNAALEELGVVPHTVQQCKIFIGDGVETFARRALPEDRRDAESVTRCVELFRREYNNRWMNKTKPYDGIPELIEGLAACGLVQTVLSNKPDVFTRPMVEHFFGNDRFAVVLGARQGVPIKPDPAAALEIAAKLKIPPSAFLYLGDTNTDMLTARAAGMTAVGVLWGFRSAEELSAHGAKTLIKHPLDLLKML